MAQAEGMDIKTIMDITGIKDQKTLNRYLSVSIDTKTDKLTKMFEYLTPKVEPEPNERDEAIETIKEALLTKGLNNEDIDKLLNHFKN